MDLLLIPTHTALCVAVFKIFRIPMSKWTVPTSVLGGILINHVGIMRKVLLRMAGWMNYVFPLH